MGKARFKDLEFVTSTRHHCHLRVYLYYTSDPLVAVTWDHVATPQEMAECNAWVLFIFSRFGVHAETKTQWIGNKIERDRIVQDILTRRENDP